jgi:hypothetical protein
MSKTLLVLAAASMLPVSVERADTPKEGVDSFANIWVVTSSNTNKLGDDSTTTFELDGAQKSANSGGMFDNLGGHCVGITEMIGGKDKSHGSCTKVDKDGDQFFELWAGAGGAGTATLTGGTGKFAGMTGSEEYTAQLVKSPSGRGLFITSTKVRWKLP